MLTNFHENWKGAGIFCVELTWNDPYAIHIMLMCKVINVQCHYAHVH